MLYKKVEELEPGDRVQHNILHPISGVVLITPSKDISEKEVAWIKERLSEAGITAVWVQSGALLELDNAFEDHLYSQRRAFYNTITRSVVKTDEGYQSTLTYHDYKLMVSALADAIIGSINKFAFLETGIHYSESAIEESAVRCYLSLALSAEIGDRVLAEIYALRKRYKIIIPPTIPFTSVGLGALAMGLDDPKTALERIDDPIARCIIRQRNLHYRCHDDKCEEIHGKEIYPYSRVCHVAAKYARLHIAEKRVPVQALYEISYDRTLDPEFRDAFLRSMYPFPLGHKVVLSDGSEAVVIGPAKSDGRKPCRPVVKIVGEDRTIDLRKTTDLSVKSYDGVDCSEFYYEIATGSQ